MTSPATLHRHHPGDHSSILSTIIVTSLSLPASALVTYSTNQSVLRSPTHSRSGTARCLGCACVGARLVELLLPQPVDDDVVLL
eukprot:16433796-Heterocapsa_arctica.AAC.1